MSECPACGYDITPMPVESYTEPLWHHRRRAEEAVRQVPPEAALELAELFRLVHGFALRDLLERRGTGGL